MAPDGLYPFRREHVASPDRDAVKLYERKYHIWKTLYPALKGSFELIGKKD